MRGQGRHPPGVLTLAFTTMMMKNSTGRAEGLVKRTQTIVESDNIET